MRSDLATGFIAQARELLDAAEDGLMQLAEDRADRETIHTVFRAVHSVRAGAGFLGLAMLQDLARRMEVTLDLIRNRDMEPGQAVTDALLQALDTAAALLGPVDPPADMDMEGPGRALKAARENAAGPEVLARLESVAAPRAASRLPRFRTSRYALERKQDQGNVYLLHLDLGQDPLHLINELTTLGEVLDSVPLSPEKGGEGQRFEVLYASVLEADLLAAGLGLGIDALRLLGRDELAGPEDSLLGEPEPTAPPPSLGGEPAPDQAHAPEPPPPPAAPAALYPAEAEEPAAGPKEREYLTFTLAGEVYGVEVLKVQEIIGLPPVSRLPRSPRFVLGVINLRGMVVPVMDLRLRLGLPAPQGPDPVVVLLRLGSKVVGALVDEVNDVIQVSPGAVREAPEFAGPVDRDDLRGLISRGREMVILPDLDRLLAPENQAHVA